MLSGIAPEQMDRATPCEGWVVADVVEHVVHGNELVPVRLGIRAEPPARPQTMADAHARSARDAQQAFENSAASDATVCLAVGDVPVPAYLRMRATDAFAHAWDLARATGQASSLDAELAHHLLAVCREQVSDAFRGPGRPFAAAQPCTQTRPPADQLAAFLGRAVD